MKLELKHLAPYLPYGLKINHKTIGQQTLVSYVKYQERLNKRITIDYFLQNTDVYKPILRPLSDLTEDFVKEVYGEDSDFIKMRYAIVIHYKMVGETFSESIPLGSRADRENIYYSVFLYNTLLKHNFDVFGLIPEGLAVDINTL